jgi:hypothetical protein
MGTAQADSSKAVAKVATSRSLDMKFSLVEISQFLCSHAEGSLRGARIISAGFTFGAGGQGRY